mgnify:CR=1 FL=1
MSTITLPDELNLNSSHSIEIYDYVNIQEISKQQIILSKNTFSFLQNGTKKTRNFVLYRNRSKIEWVDWVITDKFLWKPFSSGTAGFE